MRSPGVARRIVSAVGWRSLNRLIVPFGRSPGRSLPAPVQAMAQEVPDARWVVRHTSHPLDHLSRTSQGPQVVGIAVSFGAFDPFDFNLSELFAIQLRQSSSPAVRTQSVST